MSKDWPSLPLGAVLRRSGRTETPLPDAVYREVTVRLWGKGAVLRRVVSGASLGSGRRFVAQTGQLILSRIDARNGAIALVPAELHGALVTNDFPLFEIDRDKLEPEFLGWLVQTRDFVELCQRASEGTTNRVRLQESRFLTLEIPLPPLAEQRRIVAKIEELAGKIEEAQQLRTSAASKGDVTLLSGVGQVFGALCERLKPTTFGQFDAYVTSGPRHWNQYYSATGHRFYRAQDISSSGSILEDSKVFVDPPNGTQGRHALLQPGDLLIVITGATVGRCAAFTADQDQGFVNQHVAICRLPQQHILPQFAFWGLRGPAGQEQLLRQRYGQGKPGLNLGNIRALALPIPPLSEQRRIVAYLDDLQAKIDQLKSLQAQTAAELEALLPSVLDKAFRGEL